MVYQKWRAGRYLKLHNCLPFLFEIIYGPNFVEFFDLEIYLFFYFFPIDIEWRHTIPKLYFNPSCNGSGVKGGRDGGPMMVLMHYMIFRATIGHAVVPMVCTCVNWGSVSCHIQFVSVGECKTVAKDLSWRIWWSFLQACYKQRCSGCRKKMFGSRLKELEDAHRFLEAKLLWHLVVPLECE
jgi:hypothetical protein